ncbi:24174_t:CDS:10 [Cetraspora pellucida]|uniref:24174_t:CDS:1 n=1 Tax=Cetraspora pellucida TaxID=1433469 RepID=A0A9N9GFP0_9GLOM|nr:24174_t:CDS:10 [Cetraspora pellucida]
MNNDNIHQSYGYDTAPDSNVHYVPSQTGTNAYSHQPKRRRKNTLPDQISNDYISALRGPDQGYGSTQIRDVQTTGYPNSNYQHSSISAHSNTSQPLTFEAPVNNQQVTLNNARPLSIESNHSIYGQTSKPLPSSIKMSSAPNINHQRQISQTINGISDNPNWYYPVQNNVGHTNPMLSNGQFATQDLNTDAMFPRQQMTMLASTQSRDVQQRPVHTVQSQPNDNNSVTQQNLQGCWLLPQPFYFSQPIDSSINNTLQSELSPSFNSIATEPRISIGQTPQFGQQSLMEISDGLGKKLDRSLTLLKSNDQTTLRRACEEIANCIKNPKKYTLEIIRSSEIQNKLFSCLKLIRYCRDDCMKFAIDVFQTVLDNLNLFPEAQVQMQFQQWFNELNQVYHASQRSMPSNKQPVTVSDSISSVIGNHGASRISTCQIQPTRSVRQQQPSISVANPIPQRRSTSSNIERVDRSKWAGRLIDHAWIYGISLHDSLVQQSLVQHNSTLIPIAKESIYISQETFNRIWRSETPKLPINSTPSQLPLTYRLISRRTKNIDIDPKSDKCDWPPEEACFSVYLNNNLVKLERKQRILHNGVEQYQGVDRPVDVSRYINAGWNTITINQCGCEREISIQVFAWESQEFVLRLARLQRLTYEHGLSIAKVKQSRSGGFNGSYYVHNTAISENSRSNPGHTTIDDDDEVTAYKMTVSLKCPLSMVRIKEPAKGLYCVHIGCFDLETYVQVNMVHTKWTCPVCNGIVTSETLRVDDYFIKLLEQFSSNVSKIAIDSNGIWSIVEQDDNDTESSDDESSNVKRRDHNAKESSVTLIVLDDDDDDDPVPPMQSTHSTLPKQSEAQIPQSTDETINTSIMSSPISEAQMRSPPTLESLISSPVPHAQTRNSSALASLISSPVSNAQMRNPPALDSLISPPTSNAQIRNLPALESLMSSPISDTQTRDPPTLDSLMSSSISDVQTQNSPALESLALVASTQMHLPQPSEPSSHIVPQIPQIHLPLLVDPLPSPDANNDVTASNAFKAHYRTQEANPSTSTPPNDKDPPSDNDRWEEYSEEEVEQKNFIAKDD